jgi:hypothetical protein
MAFTYDLTTSDNVYQYSPNWFCVFIRYDNTISFDRSLNGIRNNSSGKTVSIPGLNPTARKGTTDYFKRCHSF